MFLLAALAMAPAGAFFSAGRTCLQRHTRRLAPPQLAAADPHGYDALHSQLIQRAVQSLCYTQTLSRDPISAQWLERFEGHTGMAEFHGIDGLRLPWREYLQRLLCSPAEQLIVESKLQRNRGLSASNPYQQPTPISYTVEVQPASIANQIMAVALDLANEWQDDLSRIEAENKELIQRRRDEVIDESNATVAAMKRMPAFEGNHLGGADSPHRSGNYDLLRALITRQALRQTLRELKGLPSRSHEFCFLEKLSRRPELSFSGELPYHRAEELIRALLESPFSMRARADGKPQLLDPLLLADSIMDRRADLAQRWIEMLRSGTPQKEFLKLKQNWLAGTLKLDIGDLPSGVSDSGYDDSFLGI